MLNAVSLKHSGDDQRKRYDLEVGVAHSKLYLGNSVKFACRTGEGSPTQQWDHPEAMTAEGPPVRRRGG